MLPWTQWIPNTLNELFQTCILLASLTYRIFIYFVLNWFRSRADVVISARDRWRSWCCILISGDFYFWQWVIVWNIIISWGDFGGLAIVVLVGVTNSWGRKILLLGDGWCVVQIFGGCQIPWFRKNDLTLILGGWVIICSKSGLVIIRGITVAGDLNNSNLFDDVACSTAFMDQLRFLWFLNLFLILVIFIDWSFGPFDIFNWKLHRDRASFILLFESTTFMGLIGSLFNCFWRALDFFDLVLALLLLLGLILFIINLLE